MKEYQNRNLKPLVNPPVTYGEFKSEPVSATISVSIDGFMFDIVNRNGKWSVTHAHNDSTIFFIRALEKARKIAKERNS